jgi:predicted PurR-regulated permease PerM
MNEDDAPAGKAASGAGAPEATGEAPRTPELAELIRPGPTPAASWWRAGAIGGLAIALAAVSLFAVRLLIEPLLLLVIAIAIAEALAPTVERLERRMPRPLAVAAIYIAFVLAVGLLGWLTVPSLVDQGRELAENAPDLVERGRARIDSWVPGGGDRIAETAQGRLGGFGGGLVDLPFTIATSIAEFVLVVAMSFYWLTMAPALRRFARSFFPPERQAEADGVMDEVGSAVGGYLRGEGLTALLMAGIVYAGLSIIGVDYALVLALITGVGELIPVLGPVLAAIPALAVALLDSPTQAVIVLVFFIVVQQLESNVLLPNIMQREAGTPPLLALFALFAGGAAYGLTGAIAAIPFAAALRVIVLRVVAPAIRDWTGASTGVSRVSPSRSTDGAA